MQVPVGEFRFDVEVSGPEDGEPVLLLHGFPQNRHSWDAIVPELNRAGLRTIAPDQRGYSPGARPAGADSYALPLLGADAVGVLDALGVESAHVVGHDWGAVVAWYLAAENPSRVRTLTAMSMPHLEAYWWALRNDPVQRQLSQYIAFFTDEASTAALLADDAAMLRSLFGPSVAQDQVERYLALHTQPGVLDATLNWYRSGSLLDSSERLGMVSAPTTLISSDWDRAASRKAVEKAGDHVSGPYRLVTLEGVSHWQPEEAPERITAEILERVGGRA
ncbi:alpha/beta fold hydrolase [Kitasatospora sp. A2-31]|uniref:alpha/beta fold hydrolase n=1 Tax=Kitasatospora sp. A2-31 TaxID=2916414 RepID=UPI001EE9C6DF|nr:alpha/beta hydrolase [Kitasatospora sp. A2-31]MCG6495243.1 alpha/beta hydrolase [Kitasatospora sp. A2-31]